MSWASSALARHLLRVIFCTPSTTATHLMRTMPWPHEHMNRRVIFWAPSTTKVATHLMHTMPWPHQHRNRCVIFWAPSTTEVVIYLMRTMPWPHQHIHNRSCHLPDAYHVLGLMHLPLEPHCLGMGLPGCRRLLLDLIEQQTRRTQPLLKH
eukprot:scaffold29697_cov20-Tisochrysis_lutea.AAC.1